MGENFVGISELVSNLHRIPKEAPGLKNQGSH